MNIEALQVSLHSPLAPTYTFEIWFPTLAEMNSKYLYKDWMWPRNSE